MPKLNRRRLMSSFAVLATAPMLGLSVGAFAQQAYPNKPIKMIAPYPPGGGVDTVARLVAERLSARIGQTIAVENRPGAGGTIGADALAKSPADGYTVLLGSITDYAIAPHVHKNLGFDMQRDFIPVIEVGFGTVGLVVNADLPVKNVRELIAFAKAQPGKLSYASSGVGGSQHLNAEMFMQMTGVELVHVPYKGTTQFLPDLMSGRVQMSIDSMPAHLPHIKSGKIRALAVATSARVPILPNVPTMAEAGLPGYETATNYTLFVPKGTPADIVSLLNRETNVVLQQADVKEKLLTLGIITIGGTTESAKARIPAEIAKWSNVIKKGNIKLN
jgi:tripartite-type tricarboxylate transporter receptor subunit TctC